MPSQQPENEVPLLTNEVLDARRAAFRMVRILLNPDSSMKMLYSASDNLAGLGSEYITPFVPDLIDYASQTQNYAAAFLIARSVAKAEDQSAAWGLEVIKVSRPSSEQYKGIDTNLEKLRQKLDRNPAAQKEEMHAFS